MNPYVRLTFLNGVALILPYPSGVEYRVQVGGNASIWRSMEGVLCPFNRDVAEDRPDDDLLPKLKSFAYRSWLTEDDADEIDAYLRACFYTSCAQVDRSRLKEACYETGTRSCGCWVHVLLDHREGEPQFTGFDVERAVLTWARW